MQPFLRSGFSRYSVSGKAPHPQNQRSQTPPSISGIRLSAAKEIPRHSIHRRVAAGLGGTKIASAWSRKSANCASLEICCACTGEPPDQAAAPAACSASAPECRNISKISMPRQLPAALPCIGSESSAVTSAYYQ